MKRFNPEFGGKLIGCALWVGVFAALMIRPPGEEYKGVVIDSNGEPQECKVCHR